MQVQEQAQSFLDNERDKPRGRPVVKMTVRNERVLHLTLPDGNVVPMSDKDQEITLYADNAHIVLAQVEDEPEQMERAIEAFELQVARDVRKALGAGTVENAQQIRDRIKAGDADLVALAKRVRATTPHSVQSKFAELVGRDPKPLAFAKLIEGSEALEPQKLRELQTAKLAQDTMQSMMGSAFQNAVQEAAQKLVAERAQKK